MKSTWAFKNGIRIMNEALESGKESNKFDFIFVNGANRYAENKKGVLVVKTYSNKTQGLNKVKQLNSLGIDCDLSVKWPFTIIK